MPAFMLSVADRSSSASAIAAHAGTACQAKVAFIAFHASAHLLRFGISASMRHTTGRAGQSQSGCLPAGSLLTTAQHQSATRHRHVGRLSIGSQQTNVRRPSAMCHRPVAVRPLAASARFGAVASHSTSSPQSWQSHHCLAFANGHRQLAMLQNAVVRHPQIQEGSGMHGQASISVSMPNAGSRFFASAPCLTHWSRGRLHHPALRAGQVGAPYRGR
jgi:hypothetical protein